MRLLIVLFLALATISSTHFNTSQAFAEEAATVGKAKLELGGMTCGSCKKKIEHALKAVDGVTSVSIKKNIADISFDASKVTTAQLIDAVKKAGYEAKAL